ncbi:MAG: hypothetical protein KY395_03995 [Actinobacteria bacterium]|nr:hypothetical protein [Actinomycetota bacterium]
MKYRQALHVRLQERYRRLYKAAFQAYHNEAGYLIEFLKATPALRFEIEDLERSLPELDPDVWIEEHFGWQRFELPPTERGRAKLAWHLLQKWSKEENAAAMFGHTIDHNADLPSGVRIATEQVVEPLVEYLQARLGEAADMLNLLERYVRRIEWFEKENLWAAFESRTSRGEWVYDSDLRRFLFEQGVDYPFSQPRSASGDADVVADLSGDDPLVCEVKLFDADSYGKAYVGKGFRQAVQYAHDYGKTTAYLVVFNVSGKRLELPTDGDAKEWPPRIEAEGVTVYLVRVRARPAPSASKQPKSDVVKVTREDLTGDAASED